jgi:hypothetical protein
MNNCAKMVRYVFKSQNGTDVFMSLLTYYCTYATVRSLIGAHRGNLRDLGRSAIGFHR